MPLIRFFSRKRLPGRGSYWNCKDLCPNLHNIKVITFHKYPSVKCHLMRLGSRALLPFFTEIVSVPRSFSVHFLISIYKYIVLDSNSELIPCCLSCVTLQSVCCHQCVTFQSVYHISIRLMWWLRYISINMLLQMYWEHDKDFRPESIGSSEKVSLPDICTRLSSRKIRMKSYRIWVVSDHGQPV